MSVDEDKMKFTAVYDEEKDNFFIIQDEIIDAEKNTYLIIDENDQKITLSFSKSAGLVQKRTIERRVASYVKTGYPLDQEGLRIGANFTLEIIKSEEKLPETLLTHGHTFGRGKLVRDDVPDYVEPEDNYEVESGSAAKMVDTSPKVIQVPPEPVSSTPDPVSETVEPIAPTPTQEPEPEPEPIPPILDPSPIPTKITTAPVSQAISSPIVESFESTLTFSGEFSENESSDDAIFALGQFIDQFSREGKIIVVYFEDDKYKLMKLKELKTNSQIESKYKLDGLDLYQI